MELACPKFDYSAEELIRDAASRLATCPPRRHSGTCGPLQSGAPYKAETMLNTRLVALPTPDTTASCSSKLVVPDKPLWSFPPSFLSWKRLELFRTISTELRSSDFLRPEMGERWKFGRDDDGSEWALTSWAWPNLLDVVRYAAILVCQELQVQCQASSELSDVQLREIFGVVDRLEPTNGDSLGGRTTANYWAQGTFHGAIKTPQSFGEVQAAILAKATEKKHQLASSWSYFVPEGVELKKYSLRNTHTALRQITERLLRDRVCDGQEGFFTNILGVLYRYTVTEDGRFLNITENLLPAHAREAVEQNEARLKPETYEPLVRHVLDYSIKSYRRILQHLVEFQKAGKPLPTLSALSFAEEVRAEAQSSPGAAGMPSSSFVKMSPWMRAKLLAAKLALAPAVYSDRIGPVPLQGGWFRQYIPTFNFLSHFTDLHIECRGNLETIWMDHAQGLVFKQFEEEKDFYHELSFLKRLAGFPWVPKVLGTTSRSSGVWGILMLHEGTPVDGDWADFEGFVRNCMQELQIMGIHHHDLAPRNILRRVDGSLVLIDFGNAMDARLCVEEDCPDFWPEREWY